MGLSCLEEQKESSLTVIHHNREERVFAYEEGTLVELRGEQTEIYQNGRNSLNAVLNALINIYIPSRSITALVHDNKSDLYTSDGGKIQSQLSSSSLELTVIWEAPPESDGEDEENYLKQQKIIPSILCRFSYLSSIQSKSQSFALVSLIKSL